MPGTLGTGAVTYHPDRPIVHFGSPEGTQIEAVTGPTPKPGPVGAPL